MARMASRCCAVRGDMRALILIAVCLFAGCMRQETPPVTCVSLTQGCTLASGKLFVKTDTAPTPLQPFVLTVTAPAAQEVQVELQMQGMAMGLNRYRLIQQTNGEWRASITLPACVSGRSDWLMLIDVDGERRALAFQVSR